MSDGPVHCWGGWTEGDYMFAIIGRLDADPQYTLVSQSLGSFKARSHRKD